MESETTRLLVRAARREPVERTPVWFMRQAGRILPEYRKLRERWTLIQISEQPELAVEVTMQPMRRMPLDGAILFADIMTPLIGIGVKLDIVDGVGPVIETPVRDAASLEQIRAMEPEADVPYVLEALRMLRAELEPHRTLLGFAGAPFTLAAYLIEGRSSRNFLRTKAMMYGEPALWDALMRRLTDMTIAYMRAQARAGADVLQLFDSWVGALDPADYVAYVRPHTQRIFAALRETGVPLIHFGITTATLLDTMRDDGAHVIGLDWRIGLDVGWEKVGHHLGVQGNLDPVALFAPRDVLEAKALDVLRRDGTRPGHIFNLGHGIVPETPLDSAMHLVDFVHEQSARIRGGEAALAPTT